MEKHNGESANKRPRVDTPPNEETSERIRQNNILVVKYRNDIPLPEQQQMIMEVLKSYAQSNNMHMTTVMIPQNESEKKD